MGYNAFRQSRYSFLRGCLCFALRDRENKVVGLYGRSLSSNTKSSKHFYTSGRSGLYPHYPKAGRKKLILAECVLDAATLLGVDEITKEYEVLSCYGTEGRVEQIEAIIEAKDLAELIIFFDGDKGGREGGEIVASKIAQQRGDVKIKIVATPEGEDINSLVLGHEENILQHLIEAASVYTSAAQAKRKPIEKSRKPAAQAVAKKEKGLNTKNMNNMIYVGRAAIYYIKGGMRKDLESLKVSLVIEHRQTKRKSRQKVDLYEDRQVEKLALQAAGKLQLSAEAIEEEIGKLTDLLEAYREQNKKGENQDKILLSAVEKAEYIRFGRSKNLMSKLNDLIGKSGIVGEENNRLFLFSCAVSHLMLKPLNVIVQGSSGSGKSYLIKIVSYLVPQEKVRRYTRLSEKSLYNFGEFDLCNTLIIIEDYDGMNEEVEYAIREIISNNELRSAVSAKESEHSEVKTKDKIVRGPIATLIATTRMDIYHDNSTRVFFVSVDESKEQTEKIIDYLNKKAAGLIKAADEQKAKNYLQNYVRTLKAYDVENNYLQYIKLPVKHSEQRRLHGLLENFSAQITLLHQHQRK